MRILLAHLLGLILGASSVLFFQERYPDYVTEDSPQCPTLALTEGYRKIIGLYVESLKNSQQGLDECTQQAFSLRAQLFACQVKK